MSIYKVSSGRYKAIIAKGECSIERRSLGTFDTKKEAQKAQRDALAARDRGIDLAPAKVTVADIVERYLRNRKGHLASKTLQEYEKIANRYIIPHIGAKTLAKLRPAHVAEWQQMLSESGGSEGRNLSAKSVFHARALLSAGLRWACKMQLMMVNPCSAVDAPTVRRSDAKALTRDEVARLLQATGARWVPFVTLALTLGSRRGELLALRWSSIDSENATVTISSSLSQTRDGISVKGTKTDRARTIPLSRPALEALSRQRAMQAADRLRAGESYQDAGFIFADELGGCISPMAATNAYARIATKAKISSTRLHDLRHTAATTMLLAGIDVATTAGVLGHSTPATTLGVYAHVLGEAKRKATDRLGEFFDAIDKSRTGT
ncbi:MAG: tyrosine-type recombinase/integrase [Vulcanimicrobiaceae bacterium]